MVRSEASNIFSIVHRKFQKTVYNAKYSGHNLSRVVTCESWRHELSENVLLVGVVSFFCSSNSEIKSCMHDPKFCKFHVCVCLDDVKWWHSEKRMACLKYRWGESAKNNGVRKVQMCLERKQLEIKGYKCQREHSNNFNYWKIFVWLLMPCGKEVFQHFGLIHDFVKYFLWVGCTFVKSSHMQSHPVCDSEKKWPGTPLRRLRASWSRKSHKSSARRVIALSSYAAAFKPPPPPLLLPFCLRMPLQHPEHTRPLPSTLLQLFKNSCNDQWNNGFPSYHNKLQIYSA